MPLSHTFLTLHVGQAGIQIGQAVWELLCLEHNIRPDGRIASPLCEDENEAYSSMFLRTASKHFLPRAVFIDTDSGCIDDMRVGQCGRLFNESQFVSAGEDAAGNYSVGRYEFKDSVVAKSVESVRWMMEKTELTPTFFVIHSTSGGTGSGVTMACLEQLSEMVGDTKKLEVMELSLLPGRRSLMSQAEILNSALYQSESGQLTSVSFGASNSSLFNVCSSSLGLSSATFAHANRLLAAAVSNLTATERYPGSMPCTMSSICTNVLPLRHLKYPVLACCPFLSCRAAASSDLTVADITTKVLSPSSQFVDVDPTQGKYMACALVYRGRVQSHEITKAIELVRKEQRLQFVDWCPAGFKVGIVEAPPVSAPLSGMGNPAMSVTLVSNTTAVASIFSDRAASVRAALKRNSFLHHFQRDGHDVKPMLEDAAKCLEDVSKMYDSSLPDIRDSSNIGRRLSSDEDDEESEFRFDADENVDDSLTSEDSVGGDSCNC